MKSTSETPGDDGGDAWLVFLALGTCGALLVFICFVGKFNEINDYRRKQGRPSITFSEYMNYKLGSSRPAE